MGNPVWPNARATNDLEIVTWLQPLANGRTRVTLHTDYRIRTPLNAYAAVWGELFLGDLEDNLLALIAQRAESSPRRLDG